MKIIVIFRETLSKLILELYLIIILTQSRISQKKKVSYYGFLDTSIVCYLDIFFVLGMRREGFDR